MSERVDVLEIDFTDIQKDAKATGKTLKDLRAEVKELRTTLENTAVDSDEFGDALTELTKKQQELANVTKSGVAAQKGSYNDLVNQMDLLKRQWRSTADEAERTALGAKIDDINTQLKGLDATIGNHQREVGNYRMMLKGLKEELLQLEEGTEEYNNKLAQAAEISQKMQDVNEFVAASAQDLGDHISNVTGVASGMVGAFQTVQATLNLVGVESEDVTKMIATMQNVMAITSGLKAIEGAIDPFKRLVIAVRGATIATNGFKKALISTGIGAIVVAIGTLIAYWDDLTAAIDKYIGKSDQAADINDRIIRQGEILNRRRSISNRELEREIALMKARGESEEAILNKRKELLQTQVADQVKYIKQLREQIAQAEYNIENVTSTKWTEEDVKKLKEELDEARKIKDDLYNDIYDVDTQLMVAQIKAQQEIREQLEEENKQTDKVITQAEQTIKRAQHSSVIAKEYSIPDLNLPTDREQNANKMNAISAKMMYKIDELYREYDIKMERLNRMGDRVGMSEATTQLLEDEKAALQAQYNELQMLRLETDEGTAAYQDILLRMDMVMDEIRYKSEEIKTSTENEVASKLETVKLVVGEIQEAMGSLMDVDGDAAIFNSIFEGITTGLDMASAAIKKGSKDWRDYGQMAAAGLGVASNILNDIAERQDETTEEGFEKQKKMQIAAATMGMLGGVVSAVTSAFNPANAWMTIWGQAAAAASMSAMVLATGIMQINQIKKQKFDGASSSTNATPTLSALQMMDSGVQATTNIEGASAESDVKDTRVYVLESDITNTQNNVKSTVDEATF